MYTTVTGDKQSTVHGFCSCLHKLSWKEMKTTELTDSGSPPLEECDLNIDGASLLLHKMKEKQQPTVPESLVFSFRV